ncbi:MAG TPA: redoxin domain-containing protein [Polyangiaceae bacterium]|nr:redoxin domain-containing protein [Polyangiaceae bacterium]
MLSARSSLWSLVVAAVVGCGGQSPTPPATPVSVTIPAPAKAASAPEAAAPSQSTAATAAPAPSEADADPEEEAEPSEGAPPPTAMTSPNGGATPIPAPPPSHGWLGVELEPAGTGEAGARVARVVPTSPAEAAGLVPGDLIEKLDGDAVMAPGDVVSHVGGLPSGTRVGVLLKRANAERLLAVTLGAAPSRDEILRMSFVDRPAPLFAGLSTAKGASTPSLASERGHVLVVEFWAPFCAGCRAMIPHMNQLNAQYRARGLRVLGITMEPVPRALTAATELGMEFSVASDETGSTTRAYQARAIPMVFAIDRRGNVRDVMVGFDPARLPAFDKLVGELVAER